MVSVGKLASTRKSKSDGDEEAELRATIDAIEAYEGKRWPLGKDPNVPGGKG